MEYSYKEFKPLTLMEMKFRVEGDINESEKQRASITARVTEICAELSELNSNVRRKRLSDNEYQSICESQSALKKEKSHLERQLVPIKENLRNLQHKKDSLILDIKKVPDDKAKQTMLEIRDK